MTFSKEEVECFNDKCRKSHMRQDGVARLAPDGKSIVSYCCEACYYKIRGNSAYAVISGV